MSFAHVIIYQRVVLILQSFHSKGKVHETEANYLSASWGIRGKS